MRFHLPVIVVLPLAFAACKPAASENGWGQRPEEIAELQAFNDKLTDAYEREDIAMLREMLSDDHVHNNVFGSRMTKDEFLRDIESGVLVFESYETPEIEWFVSDELAVATGVIQAKAIRGGKPVPADTFRFTRIFKREGGEWKVLLFQNAMIPPKGTLPEDPGARSKMDRP